MSILPVPTFVFTFLGLAFAAWLAATRCSALRQEAVRLNREFEVVQGATLTLLGLIVGFTFSMALDRYEQRKGLESAESAAISAAWLRADLLPAEDRQKVRALLILYVDSRVAYFDTRMPSRTREALAGSRQLQGELWAAVTTHAKANPTSLTALAVSAVGEVVTSAGDSEAAWNNRIPGTAWMLMAAMAVFATLLVGIGLDEGHGFSRMLLVLPLVIATAFFLIADVESPRMGIIRVVPENLMTLSHTLRGL
jgi:hypothetical protein